MYHCAFSPWLLSPGQSMAPTACGTACWSAPTLPGDPGARAQTSLTFAGLSFEDLQVTVGRLQPLAGHDLALEVTQGDAVAMERDHVVAQLGGELVVDTRHGPAVPARPPLPRHTLASRPDLAGVTRAPLPRWAAQGDPGQTRTGCHEC